MFWSGGLIIMCVGHNFVKSVTLIVCVYLTIFYPLLLHHEINTFFHTVNFLTVIEMCIRDRSILSLHNFNLIEACIVNKPIKLQLTGSDC